jgi:serine/threonine-protein kinase
LLQQAEEREPSLDAILAIAENYKYNRRWDEAVAAYQEHQRRNPESTIGPSNLAWIAWDRTGDTGEIREFLATQPTGWPVDRWNLEMLDRDYEAALAALDYSDNDVFRGQYGIHPKAFYRGVSQKWMGDEAAAEASFQEARQIMEAMLPELDHDCRVHAGLADIYASLGMREEAVAEGMRAEELVPVEMDALSGPPNHMAMARVYSVLGDAEAAAAELRYLLSIPSSLTRTGLRLAPVWDPIRDDPSFQALLEE